MRAEFWLDRWEQGDTPWQLDRVNPLLQQHLPSLGIEPGARIFLPLCGATLDLGWLRSQGFDVVGVDLAEASLQAVADAEGLERQAAAHVDGLQCFAGEHLTLWCGDYFALTPKQLGRVDAIWDRAALVALPPEMRREYARHMLDLTPDRPPLLCWTLEYEQARMDGPPFSVSADELKQLWGREYRLETLLARDVLSRSPAFAKAGLTALQERLALLSRWGCPPTTS